MVSRKETPLEIVGPYFGDIGILIKTPMEQAREPNQAPVIHSLFMSKWFRTRLSTPILVIIAASGSFVAVSTSNVQDQNRELM